MQLCMLLFPALSSASDVKQLMKEIVKMVNFDHPNVMTLTGVILVEGGAPLLVMPYMVKGTLLNYVRENKEQFLVEEDPDNPDEVHYKHVYIQLKTSHSIRRVWFSLY